MLATAVNSNSGMSLSGRLFPIVLNNLIEAVELVGKGARGGKRAAFSTASAPVRRRRIVVRPRGRFISTVQ
ncbi:MAG: hypothetical protein ACREYE_13825, partial [Gammaproteobacteria bacterium]